MKIDMKSIKVAEVVSGYEDKGEAGVRGYDGRLNIRPAFQREFIYKDRQRNEVIHTLRRGFPLNTMYWAKADEGFELMDGQQRTISICQYVHGDYPVTMDDATMYFHNLTGDKQKLILNYELSVYVCEGSESEKLDWFKIINIAGEKLADQELRNAIYTGAWLADAKRWFSRSGGPAYQRGEKYVNGSAIRQDYLENALDWISDAKIEAYMGLHQHDMNASELWQYFQSVIDWVERIFPHYRSLMKGRPWGRLYNNHKDDKLNAASLEQRIVELIADEEVDNKRGIYEYLLTGNEKTLSLRTFNDKMRVTQYERQKGVCPVCKKHFALHEMEADHIVPWHSGGKTTLENCQLLCKIDNRTKSGK